jgi:uncharacterized protein
MVEFEWDELKNKSNQRKHGISFEDASLVFDDPQVVLFIERFQEGEERWHALGGIPGTILMIVVVHVYREEAAGEVVRIISARRALAWERRLYDEANA